MNEPLDPLEAELRSLRPVNLASGVRNRIAQELQVPPVTAEKRPGRLPRWTVILVAVAASCLVTAWFLRPQPPAERRTSSDTALLEPPTAAAFDDTLPSIWTYRQALIRSSSAAEALLDKHAASGPAAGPTPANFFTHADRQLLLKGEL